MGRYGSILLTLELHNCSPLLCLLKHERKDLVHIMEKARAMEAKNVDEIWYNEKGREQPNEQGKDAKVPKVIQNSTGFNAQILR